MIVETQLDTNNELYQTYLKGYRGDIGFGEVIPQQITHMSPLSEIAEIDQITKRLPCLDQW